LKVAVIGASGGMGSFFVNYFLAKGETVRASDPALGARARQKSSAGVRKRQEDGRSGTRLETVRSNSDAVVGCDVTILAVPMDRTLDVAEEVADVLKPGSILVEIASVKGKILSSLRKLVGGRVVLLSIHPLFGPALETTEGMKIALISGEKRTRKGGSDVGDDGDEVSIAKRLFPEARMIEMTRKQHDKTMAVILSLTHMLNIVYAGTVLQFLSPKEFMRASTPNSSVQLTLAEAVLAQDAELSYAIQARNAYSSKVGRAAWRELRRVLRMIEDSDRSGYDKNFRRLSESYDTERRASVVMREIYSAAEKVS
jgi:prephenate dehydrogenase